VAYEVIVAVVVVVEVVDVVDVVLGIESEYVV
jgi:hypothetical protein